MPKIIVPQSFTAEKAEEINQRYTKAFPSEFLGEIEKLIESISVAEESKIAASYIVAEFLNCTLVDKKGNFSSQKYHHKSEFLTLLEEPVKTLLLKFAEESLKQLENPIQNLIKKSSLKELATKSQILILLGDSYPILAQTDEALKRAFNYYLLANGTYPNQGKYPTALYKLASCYEFGLGVKEDKDKALEYYEEAALLGLAENQYMLGQSYESGGNIKKAIECYEKASEEDDIGSMLKLASLYKNGVKKYLATDEGEALSWYKKAANLGSEYAASEISRINDQASEQYELAAKIFKDAISEASGIKDLEQRELVNKTAVEKAFNFYQKAAKVGHPGALFRLGIYYEEVYKNTVNEETDSAILEAKELEAKKEAFYCYQKSAEQGYAPAQHALGKCYEEGIGVEKDEAKAFKLYEASAKGGFAKANADFVRTIIESTLGDIKGGLDALEEKINLLPNDEKPVEEIAFAANPTKNDIKSKTVVDAPLENIKTEPYEIVLELLNPKLDNRARKSYDQEYHKGDLLGFLTKDQKETVFGIYDKSSKELVKVAEEGNAGVANLIGSLYLANPVKKNMGGALYSYKLSADKQNPEGQYNLGLFYEKGLGGLEKDKNKALELYQKAAEKGYKWAQFGLAVFYENEAKASYNDRDPSFVVTDNVNNLRTESFALYQSAAKQGFVPAISRLADFYKNGSLGGSTDELPDVNDEENLSVTDAETETASEADSYSDLSPNKNINEEKAFKFYEKAAQTGDTTALVALAKIYQEGELTSKEPILALRYYVEAENRIPLIAPSTLEHSAPTISSIPIKTDSAVKPKESTRKSVINSLKTLQASNNPPKAEEVIKRQISEGIKGIIASFDDTKNKSASDPKRTSSLVIPTRRSILLPSLWSRPSSPYKTLSSPESLHEYLSKNLTENTPISLTAEEILRLIDAMAKVPELLAELKNPKSCFIGKLVTESNKKEDTNPERLDEINDALSEAIGFQESNTKTDPATNSTSMINDLRNKIARDKKASKPEPMPLNPLATGNRKKTFSTSALETPKKPEVAASQSIPKKLPSHNPILTMIKKLLSLGKERQQ